MKIIKVSSDGRYTHHGIGYTEHSGFAGTADNRWSLRLAIEYELRSIRDGEEYQVEINGKNDERIFKNQLCEICHKKQKNLHSLKEMKQCLANMPEVA